jgi:hypothetical protein
MARLVEIVKGRLADARVVKAFSNLMKNWKVTVDGDRSVLELARILWM